VKKAVDEAKEAWIGRVIRDTEMVSCDGGTVLRIADSLSWATTCSFCSTKETRW